MGSVNSWPSQCVSLSMASQVVAPGRQWGASPCGWGGSHGFGPTGCTVCVSQMLVRRVRMCLCAPWCVRRKVCAASVCGDVAALRHLGLVGRRRLQSKLVISRFASHAHEFDHPNTLVGSEDVARVCNAIALNKLMALLHGRKDGVARFCLRRTGSHIAVLAVHSTWLRTPNRCSLRLSPHGIDMA